MTGHASRATVDFDAFERELRQTSQEAVRAKAPQVAPKGDPLAELARIVGQDDPFRALLEAREKNAGQDAPAPAAPAARAPETGRPARVEPTFVDAPLPSSAHGPMQGQPQSPADAFDQYLASVEQGMYADGPTDPAAFAQADKGYRTGRAEAPRARNRLVQVGAGLAVVAVCVGGALAWRGTHGVGGGGPITVLADKTPLKVQPTATDGVEIPDQNKQIYDRNAKDGQIKIVNREEQPLDVNQAARTAAARSEGTEPGQGGATPGQGGMLSDTFGEPRRVRTVSVKPDTPVLQPPAETAQAHAQAPSSPIPTMTMPDASGGTTTPAAEARRPTSPPSRTLASNPAPAATTPVAEEPPAAPAARPKAPQRLASVSPETTASTTEPAAASASLTAPVSGYSVQLGVRGSESEARAAFREMQGKYSQLAGKPELIRQAEVNGKTLFRVRVGPLAKNEASSLCSALQGAGGQCFVAKN
ncbi:sporulation domain-containing protein [Methylorubrum populi]|uniref:Sporulation domain-containing protein n=1 Tax=Methylorubrum populi TaxID=223967 RepID=A0A160PG95_9HYPH|nr:SPOR domain-containing protein [Methylorubrum populi]BAU92289.1 sporulation domain-containing protein [Methylorubrum populi]